MINIAGIANVADALCAIRELVFGGKVSAAQLTAALESDFDLSARETPEQLDVLGL